MIFLEKPPLPNKPYSTALPGSHHHKITKHLNKYNRTRKYWNRFLKKPLPLVEIRTACCRPIQTPYWPGFHHKIKENAKRAKLLSAIDKIDLDELIILYKFLKSEDIFVFNQKYTYISFNLKEWKEKDNNINCW